MGWEEDAIVEAPSAEGWEHDPVVEDKKIAPSMLAVAGNAAYKGLAGTLDLGLNIAGAAGESLIPYHLRPKAPRNIVRHGLKAIGLINEENEPQTPAQRIVDTGVQAGVGMLANPAKGGLEVAKNVALGITSGLTAGATKEATGSDLLAMIAGVATPFAVDRMAASGAKYLQNAVGQQTFQEAAKAGYVVPPSLVKPSMVSNRIESVAGKAAVLQDANLRNQAITTKLAAQSIGLPNKTSLTMQDIESVRAKAGQVYEQVEALRPTVNMPWFPRYHETDLVAQLKQARADASADFLHYSRDANPATLAAAKKNLALAESLDKDIASIAQAAGKPELVQQLKAARSLYARTYDVERALNVADGTVSAQVIGSMLDKGKPLSGELKTIGKFAQAFPTVTRDAAKVQSPSVSGVDPMSSALLGGAGYAAGGPAGAAIGAGLPMLRAPMRNLALSRAARARMLRQPEPYASTLLKGGIVGRSVLDYRNDIEE